MDPKKKNFDAIKMVRGIRDAHYEQTKNMTPQERLTFYRDKGQEAQEMLKRLVHSKSDRLA
jgi:hypothetical protein